MNTKRSGRYLHAQAGWAEVDGQRIYFRSKKERRHAEHLGMLRRCDAITKWEHEPERFTFPIRRGATSYLPDFRVTYPDGNVEYHEVKGWLDPKSLTQLCRMARYYPEVVVKLYGRVKPEQHERIEKARGVGMRAVEKAERRQRKLVNQT